MKPRMFIGSSTEGLEIAYAVQSNLEDDAEITVWTQDVFRPSEFILESLLEQLDAADIGVFVFSPDDTIIIRDVEQPAVRDNVIFEVGLYVGRLGRDRCFLVAPRGGNPRLPSDLLGVTIMNYDGARSDGNLEAALGPATGKIRSAVKALAPMLQPMPPELCEPVLVRKGMLSAQQRVLLEQIESRAPITKAALGSLSSNFSESELHYRLEQLRLLQFVVVNSTGDSNETPTVELHPLYAFARQGKRNLRTT